MGRIFRQDGQVRAETANQVEAIKKSLALLKQRMDWETASHRLEEFDAMIEDPDLWNDQERAQKLMRDRQMLIDAIETSTGIEQDMTDNVELIELAVFICVTWPVWVRLQNHRVDRSDLKSQAREPEPWGRRPIERCKIRDTGG